MMHSVAPRIDNTCKCDDFGRVSRHSAQDALVIESGKWYAYEMLPGYSRERYYSPILVQEVIEVKRGQGNLRLSFYNACYAQGVQDFVLDLRVLWTIPDYLIAEVFSHGSEPSGRCVIISEITLGWLDRNLHGIMQQNPPTPIELTTQSVSEYLHRLTSS